MTMPSACLDASLDCHGPEPCRHRLRRAWAQAAPSSGAAGNAARSVGRANRTNRGRGVAADGADGTNRGRGVADSANRTNQGRGVTADGTYRTGIGKARSGANREAQPMTSRVEIAAQLADVLAGVP